MRSPDRRRLLAELKEWAWALVVAGCAVATFFIIGILLVKYAGILALYF